MPMTKAERAELRLVLRQQFKVLRAEVDQREHELAAEAANRVRERYADVDKLVADVNGRIQAIVDQAAADIRAVMKALDPDDIGRLAWSGRTGGAGLRAPQVEAQQENRLILDRALRAGIAAEVHAAKVRLDRQEADLMRALALGALESAEAHEFLRTIPAVAQLVPAARLAEIEARWDEEHEGGEPS